MKAKVCGNLKFGPLFHISFVSSAAIQFGLRCWQDITYRSDSLRPHVNSKHIAAMRLSAPAVCLFTLLTWSSTGGTTSADTHVDFVSTGGVGYLSRCTSEGMLLSAAHPTTRVFGYRSTLHTEQFLSEQMLLKCDCTVTSNELGAGNWCEATGSNAGFEVSFIRETFVDNHSYNSAEFFGQEVSCSSLKTDCLCSDQTTD